MKRGNHQAGQALVVVALLLVVLLLAAGLGIDMGYLRYQRRLEQTAADSAAVAGAAKLNYCVGSPGCQAMLDEGKTNSAYDGFTDNPPTTTVAINNPPLSGPHEGDVNYVEAIITQNVSTFFVKILGPALSSFPVTARAVAASTAGPSCIYALNSMVLAGFQTAVDAANCVLSDSGDLTIENAASHVLTTKGTIYGGTYTPGGAVDPAPVHGASVGDPLSYLSNTPPSASAPVSPCVGYTYCQGAYPSGINITGSSSVTFQPGTYVLGGTGLSISGSGDVTGTGVTFYISGNGSVLINDLSAYSTCTDAVTDPSALNLGRKVQLIAPTDPNDPQAGILLVQSGNQNSAITLNNGDDCLGNGPSGSASYLWGVLYFPSAQLTLTGTGLDFDEACSNVPRFTVVVAGTFYPVGDINVGVGDCPRGSSTPYTFPTPIPDPIKDAVLVE